MINQCSNDIIGIKELKCCDEGLKKTNAIITARNGMAKKAMLKNVVEGNVDKLKKQIKKGSVQIYYQ